MPHSAWDHRNVVDEGLHDENSSDSKTGRSRSIVKRKRRSTSNACFLSFAGPHHLVSRTRAAGQIGSVEHKAEFLGTDSADFSRVQCHPLELRTSDKSRVGTMPFRSHRAGGCRITPRTETDWHLRGLGQIGASAPARPPRKPVLSSHPNRERPGHGSSLAESYSTWLVVRGLHWGTYTRPSKYA